MIKNFVVTLLLLAGSKFLHLKQVYRNTTFIRPIYQNLKNNNLHQKDCYQDNLSFACLQFYMHNGLNKLPGISCFRKHVKN